ncbi:putative conserved hypothetical protein, partial [Serratia symbiotica str. Tucson]
KVRFIQQSPGSVTISIFPATSSVKLSALA